MARDTTPDPAAEPAISDGPNARPRDETIGQSGRGEPDDSSRQIDIAPEEEAAIAHKILERPPEPDRG